MLGNPAIPLLRRPRAPVLLALEVIGLLLLLGLALWADVKTRNTVRVDVGRRGDFGYLASGFYGREQDRALPTSRGSEPADYRWTAGEAVLRFTPLAAGTPYTLRLRLLGLEPQVGGSAPRMVLTLGSGPPMTATLLPYLADYVVTVPAQALQGGELRLAVRVDPPVRAGARVVGALVDRVELRALEVGQHGLFPYLYPLPAHAVALLLAVASCWCFGLARRWRLLLAGLVAGIGLAGTAFWPAAAPHVGTVLLAGVVVVQVVGGVVRLAGPRWRTWAGWLGAHAEVVLLALFLLGVLLSFSPRIEADGVEYYAYLRSLAFDGDLHFANEYAPEVPFLHVPTHLQTWKTATGYEMNAASVGPAIAWIPFFAVGHLMALAGRALGLGWTVDGFSEPYVVWIGFGSALSGLVTLLLGYDLVQRLWGRSLGLLSTLATFLGTTMFYFVFYQPDFAHALASCAVTVFVYLWMRTRQERTPRQWFWLGLAAGAMTIFYWIDALFVILPVLSTLWDAVALLRERRGRDVGRLALGGILFIVAFVLAFSPQIVAWRILFGKWLTVPQEGFATPRGFVPLALLGSPLHGLLPWTPIAVVGMAGLLLLAWEKRPWGIFVLLTFALFFLYNATLGSWHGGGPFGLRRLTNAYPFFLLGVAALLSRVRRWRAEAAVIAALLPTLWGLTVLLRYLTYLVPHHPQALAAITLGEFLFVPDNVPIAHLPGFLQFPLFVKWARRLWDDFHPASLLYGVVLLRCFGVLSVGVAKVLGAFRKRGD